MKVKSKDLRVGNWVFNDYLKKPQLVYPMMIQQIATIEKEGKDVMMSYLPITSECLMRAGFNGSPDWSIKKFDGTTNVLDLGYLFLASNMMSDSSVTLYEHTGLSTGVHCDYMHQIQNLYFALKGEELPIKDLENEASN